MNNPDFIKKESISLPVLVALSLPFLPKIFFSLFVFNVSLLFCKEKLTFIVCQGKCQLLWSQFHGCVAYRGKVSAL